MTQSNKFDPIAGAVRQGLRAGGQVSADCASAEILGSYFERSLESQEMARWEKHFAVCLRCQEQLATLARLETALGSPHAPATVREGFWFLHWRWLTAAGASVLGALVIWVAVQNQGEKAPAAVLSARDQHTVPATEMSKQAPAPTATAPSVKGESATRSVTEKIIPPPPVPPQTAPSSGVVGFAANSAPQAKPAAAAELPVLTDKTTIAAAREKEAAAREEKDALKQAEALPDEQTQAAKQAALGGKADAPAKLGKAKQQPQATGELAPSVTEQRFRQQPELLAGQRNDAPAKKQESAEGKLSAQSTIVVTTPEAPPRANEAPGYDTGRSPKRPVPALTALAGRIKWSFFADGQIERYDERLKGGDVSKSPVAETLLAVTAPSEKVCWAVGAKGVVIRSVGTELWRQVGSPTEEDLVFVEAQDALRATVRTRSNKTYQTSDGGRTWHSQ